MNTSARTDRERSLSASEFLWETEDLTEVHQYVTPIILDLLARHKAEKILDIGCGNGAFTALIAKAGYQVVGLDYSASGIEIAQQKFKEVTFQRFDVSDPLPQEYVGQFDTVLSVEVVEHLLLPRRLIENGMQALKPNGKLIITTPFHGYLKNLALALTNKFDDHWHPLRDFGHVKFFSKSTVTELMTESGFSDVEVVTVGRIPPFARSMIAYGTKPSSL